jgi:HlyD family secretion protein
MSRTRIVVGSIIVIVLAGLGYMGYRQFLAPIPATPTPMSGTAAEPATPDRVSAEGVVVPAREATLAFRLSARVAEVLVAEGDEVAAGQPLLRLESDELRAAAAQAEAGVAQALAAIAQAEAGMDVAEAARARAEAAVDEAAAGLALAQEAEPDEPTTASDAQLAQAEARVAQAEAGEDQAVAQAAAAAGALSLAQAGLEAAQATVVLAQTQLDQATLTAPFAGTLVSLHLEVGELAAPGAPAVVLADLRRWQVRTIDLAESDVVLVEAGQRVNVTLDALPEAILAGTVTEISAVAETSRGNVTYAVTIDIAAGEARLRWGMTAFVDISVGE